MKVYFVVVQEAFENVAIFRGRHGTFRSPTNLDVEKYVNEASIGIQNQSI